MGPWHKPISHVALVDELAAEAGRRGFDVARQQFAVAQKNAALFGVMDLVPAGRQDLFVPGQTQDPTNMGLSIGFRSSQDQSMAIRGVAGRRVFVCDNMALSGDMVALARKNTTGLNLVEEIRRGFDKFLQQADMLTAQIQALSGHSLTTDEAKVVIFDAFAAKFLPVRLLDDVTGFYFQADDTTPDCQPRTLWGLHNAFTRAIKTMKPAVGFEATVAIGRHFGLTSQAKPDDMI